MFQASTRWQPWTSLVGCSSRTTCPHMACLHTTCTACCQSQANSTELCNLIPLWLAELETIYPYVKQLWLINSVCIKYTIVICVFDLLYILHDYSTVLVTQIWYDIMTTFYNWETWHWQYISWWYPSSSFNCAFVFFGVWPGLVLRTKWSSK